VRESQPLLLGFQNGNTVFSYAAKYVLIEICVKTVQNQLSDIVKDAGRKTLRTKDPHLLAANRTIDPHAAECRQNSFLSSSLLPPTPFIASSTEILKTAFFTV